MRTQRFDGSWSAASWASGATTRHAILLVLEDERQIPLPGTLDPAELDPYGDEGQELSAADQLNLLRERAMAGGLAKPAVPVFQRAADPPLAIDAPTPEGAATSGRPSHTR